MRWAPVIGFIFLLFLLYPVCAFNLQQTYIQIDQQGDAIVTLTYQDNPAEYLGIKTFLATSPAIENYQRSRGTGNTADFTILCASPGTAKLRFPHFASVRGK